MVGTVDNRPYACPVEGCDRRFFHRNNVYRHRKQKHPLEVIFKTWFFSPRSYRINFSLKQSGSINRSCFLFEAVQDHSHGFLSSFYFLQRSSGTGILPLPFPRSSFAALSWMRTRDELIHREISIGLKLPMTLQSVTADVSVWWRVWDCLSN